MPQRALHPCTPAITCISTDRVVPVYMRSLYSRRHHAACPPPRLRGHSRLVTPARPNNCKQPSHSSAKLCPATPAACASQPAVRRRPARRRCPTPRRAESSLSTRRRPRRPSTCPAPWRSRRTRPAHRMAPCPSPLSSGARGGGTGARARELIYDCLLAWTTLAPTLTTLASTLMPILTDPNPILTLGSDGAILASDQRRWKQRSLHSLLIEHGMGASHQRVGPAGASQRQREGGAIQRTPAVSQQYLALLKLDVESAEFTTLLAAAASGALWPRVYSPNLNPSPYPQPRVTPYRVDEPLLGALSRVDQLAVEVHLEPEIVRQGLPERLFDALSRAGFHPCVGKH